MNLIGNISLEIALLKLLPDLLGTNVLTHLGLVQHIYALGHYHVGTGLSHIEHQANTWTLLTYCQWDTQKKNFSDFSSK